MRPSTRSRAARGPAALLALLTVLPLLAVLAGAAAVATLVAAPASALSCRPPLVSRAGQQADAVFVGSVQSVTSRADGDDTVFTHRVVVSGVWRGRIRSKSVEVVTRSGPPSVCPLGRLPQDTPYVFFARADGDLWRVSASSGTATASPALRRSLKSLYGSPKVPVSPEPTPPALTALPVSTPATFERAAAPGAALVLVGLLGLVVVRRRRA
ncbi:hypothetical protein K8Z61_13150 [Nocardioides sp. TRM66260-LWL]|uniref:hypothetical protein n=1 Tax=Nocardioides sp. TRM66260-LWL TaxID=2874478 RepID=UPI001CC3939A|nr:hypothetical protein [Nocardioides sp. TRM66260-LWL]MBZ5735441.1 hypothetical protein [Nocardioides sp. TRM66260-LWL]